MENLDSFIEVLPVDDLQKTETFAPFASVRQSWAAGDTISRGDTDWINGNFSNSFMGALEENAASRIARRAILFVKHAGEFKGRPVYIFIHS